MKNISIGKHVIPLWLVAALIISAIGSSVLAYYVWRTLTIPLEVKEPLELIYYPSQLSLYAGDFKEFNITIQNHSSNNYSVTLDFHLSNITYQTSYVTFSNEIYPVLTGQQNFTASLEVRADAPPLTTSLTINFNRGVHPYGLVGYWRLDEGSGSIILDSSKNDRYGIIHGATWTSGKSGQSGQSLAFDGINDYVNIQSLNIFGLTSLSVEAWIKSQLNHIGYVFYNGDKGEFLLHNGERTHDGASGIHPELASFSIKTASGSINDVFSSPMTSNSWHHLVGVWIKGVCLRIYVDGVLTGENTIIPDEYLFDPGSSYPPTIGAYALGEAFYGGLVDEIRIYNRSLSTAEIEALYTN